jgi:hypothetical protein
MRKLILALAFVVGVVGPVLAQSAPVIVRVVGYELRKSGETMLTMAAGADQGVKADWKAYLVDDKGHRVEGGELTVIRVDKRMTIARTGKQMNEIRGLRVLFEP